MTLVRLLGFEKLDCGCAVGCYRDLGTNRESAYIEHKGYWCGQASHRLRYQLKDYPGRPKSGQAEDFCAGKTK